MQANSPVTGLRFTIGVTCSCLTIGLAAQTPSQTTPATASLAFDVASIKRNTSGSMAMSMNQTPGGDVTVVNSPIRMLITSAYGTLQADPIGLPDWTRTERYDVIAK